MSHLDADVRLPKHSELIPGGPREIDNSRIARLLQNQLAASGLKVACAAQASSYLCNAVYYRSLWQERATAHPATSMFLHLPADIGATMQRPILADAVSATLILARAMLATERQ